MERKSLFCKLFVSAALIVALLLHYSCVREECRQSTDANVALSFYSNNSQATPISFVLQGESNDTLMIFSMPNDAYLPLNPLVNEMSFHFVINDSVDKVTLNYLPELVLYSSECGYNYQYTLTSISHSNKLIDSIVIVNSKVTPAKMEYLRVYY